MIGGYFKMYFYWLRACVATNPTPGNLTFERRHISFGQNLLPNVVAPHTSTDYVRSAFLAPNFHTGIKPNFYFRSKRHIDLIFHV